MGSPRFLAVHECAICEEPRGTVELHPPAVASLHEEECDQSAEQARQNGADEQTLFAVL